MYAAESLARDGRTGSSAGVRALDAEVEAEHGAHAVWVAVSHGDPIKAVVAEAVGAGLAGLQRVRVDPGSLTAVHLTAHPDGAAREQHRAGRPRPRWSARPAHAPAGDSEVGGDGSADG